MAELIDRQAAIDAHCELCGDRDKCNCDICPDVEVFQLLPSAQPEPKTGRWMFPDPPIHKPICSECGKPCIGLHAFEYQLTDYCPNCGAKMKEESNG